MKDVPKAKCMVYGYLDLNFDWLFVLLGNLNKQSNIIGLGGMSKVAYLYNQSITQYHFGKDHPMKTKRIKMAHSLITSYGLSDSLRMFHSKEASREEMCSFHHPNYIKYLETWVSPKTNQIVQSYRDEERRRTREDSRLNSIYKINQSIDCPGFDGLYNFCQLAAGSSIDAADLIITQTADIAINWAGGFHHAKKTEASGFCYVNDIVLCILELLKFYPRVLYLDIDVHHGDGVEEAFYHTNRVMTVSFHQYEEDFFPGTGELQSTGQGLGKYFSVNVPLKRGIDDMSYIQLFKKIMSRVMASYRPDAIVLQCGADSLSKDALGHLNLSMKGHAQCIKHMKGYGMPMILLGGGGYTIENVARCWTYETAMLIGKQIPNEIPEKDAYFKLYQGEQHKLFFDVEKKINENSQQYLDKIVETVYENLRDGEIRPCIAFHTTPKHFTPQQAIDWKIIPDCEDSLENESSLNQILLNFK